MVCCAVLTKYAKANEKLLSVLRFPSAKPRCAIFVMADGAKAVATTSIFALSLVLRLANVHKRFAPLLAMFPTVAFVATTIRPLGMVSVTMRLVAIDGPAFVTDKV